MALVLLLAQLPPPGSLAASLSETGRWESTDDLGVIGTHVVLLREPQSNAAKLFLFGESGTNQTMKLWRFFANAETVRMPDTTFVDSNSVFVGVPHPNALENDLFCNGHSVLPDGRMMFIGGNWNSPDPCEMVYTFDPAWLDNPSGTPWTTNATMASERWYATATALADGRILAASGVAQSWVAGFGGRTAGGASDSVLRPLAIASRYHWGDTTAVPADSVPPADPTRIRQNYTTAGKSPAAREDHVFASIPVGTGLLFGGRQVLPGGADTTLGDAWLLETSPLQNDSVMTWIRLNQMDYNASPGVPEVIPPPRSRAAMVWGGIVHFDEKTRLPGSMDSLAFFLFGGRDSTGHVLSDLWLGRVRRSESRVVGWRYHAIRDIAWQRLLADDDTTRARFGHTMWFDPGDAGVAGAPYSRLVIFGGQTGDSTLADDRIYTYGVGSDPAVAGVWSAITPAAAPGWSWAGPHARQGQMAAHKWPLKAGEKREFYVYGGQDARGNLLMDNPTRQDTHLWALTRTDATAASPNYAWKWLQWSDTTSGIPVGRARAAMAFDDASKQLVVTGGDTNGDGQADGLSDELWNIQVLAYGAGEQLKWFQPLVRDLGHPAMPPTAGHTLIAYGEGGYTVESSLEAFDPAGTGDECDPGAGALGSWKTISTADSLSQRAISAYPYLFLLPDGRLFNAGPSPADRTDQPYRRFFNFGTKVWADDADVHFMDAKVMGSAVMYRPGKILRAGSHGPGDIGAAPHGTAHSRTETIEISAGAMPAWVNRVGNGVSSFDLAPRLNHNLTVLPTGDVLATGGVTGDLHDPTKAPVGRPQLWSVSRETWNKDEATSQDTLARDPKIRNYHSMALLLPDARVLTAGGEEPSDDDKWTASVYEPPYLFEGDAYARRPVVSGAPEVLRYGEPFTLTIGTAAAADTTDVDSIRTVALVRPGAVTHGFDQNQRYVPLGFVRRTNPRRLLVWAPADSFVAPPGEYMLFVTRGRGNSDDTMPVPSIAKWVVVQRPLGSQLDSLDVIAPRGGSYIDLKRKYPCASNNSITLLWKAPADDDTLGFSGKATTHNLRWVENYLAPHFNLWNAHETSAPLAVFSTDSATVDELLDGVWYRFALTSVGNNGDSSSLSNVLVAKGIICEEGSSGGSGGGGEEYSVHRGGAGSFIAHASTTTTSAEENTLLAGVPIGTRGHDLLRLRGEPARQGTLRRAFVRQGEGRGLLVDRARLLAVDHEAGSEVVSLASGVLVAGNLIPATAAVDQAGVDVTAEATGVAEAPFYADSGATLEFVLPVQQSLGSRVVLLEAMGGNSTGPGCTVEYRTESGVWLSLGSLYPRREWDTAALETPQTDRVRLVFRGAYAVRFAGELAGAAVVTPQAATLSGAESAYSGEAFDEERAAVDTSLAMVAGDTLSLLFADLEPAQAGARTWLLEVEGTPVLPREAQTLAHRREPAVSSTLPVAFALHPAAPNPTRGTVRLSFDLPQRASVRLEIFDPQGRRVRRLEGTYEAGRHSLDWDLRHSNGPRVAPGIYSYRLTAARQRAQKKLVVLP